MSQERPLAAILRLLELSPSQAAALVGVAEGFVTKALKGDEEAETVIVAGLAETIRQRLASALEANSLVHVVLSCDRSLIMQRAEQSRRRKNDKTPVDDR